nr:hypothetical protein CFP56_21749 [Quercus suber]
MVEQLVAYNVQLEERKKGLNTSRPPAYRTECKPISQMKLARPGPRRSSRTPYVPCQGILHSVVPRVETCATCANVDPPGKSQVQHILRRLTARRVDMLQDWVRCAPRNSAPGGSGPLDCCRKARRTRLRLCRELCAPVMISGLLSSPTPNWWQCVVALYDGQRLPLLTCVTCNSGWWLAEATNCWLQADWRMTEKIHVCRMDPSVGRRRPQTTHEAGRNRAVWPHPALESYVIACDDLTNAQLEIISAVHEHDDRASNIDCAMLDGHRCRSAAAQRQVALLADVRGMHDLSTFEHSAQ